MQLLIRWWAFNITILGEAYCNYLVDAGWFIPNEYKMKE